MQWDKAMPSQSDNSKSDPIHIFTREEADNLITEALDTSIDEPEPFVKLLLILFDHVKDSRLQDSMYLLIKVAYDGSLVHSRDFGEYLEALRQGHDPMAEIRAQWPSPD